MPDPMLSAEQLGHFDRLKKMAANMGRRYARSVAWYDPEDASQDALLLLCQAIVSYDPSRATGPLDDYAAGCVRRGLIQRWREQFGRSPNSCRRRFACAKNINDSDGYTAKDDLAGVEHRDECDAALSLLPPRTEWLMRLIWIDGLSHSQAGRVIGAGKSATSVMLAEARAVLRRDPDGRLCAVEQDETLKLYNPGGDDDDALPAGVCSGAPGSRLAVAA